MKSTRPPFTPERRPYQAALTSVAVTVGLLAAACGTGSTDTASSPPTSPPATQPAGAAPPSTDPGEPPTSEPSGCPAVDALPDDATSGRALSGDLDGDRAPDEIAAHTSSDGTVILRVELATGDTAEMTLQGTAGGPVTLVGLHDLDRDGDDEVFTRATGDAASDVIAIYDFTDCELYAVTLEGAPATFAIATSAAAATGLSCADSYVDDLYFAELDSTDGHTYEGRIVAYDLDAGVLTETGGEGAGYTSDDLASIAGLHCGDLAP